MLPSVCQAPEAPMGSDCLDFAAWPKDKASPGRSQKMHSSGQWGSRISLRQKRGSEEGFPRLCLATDRSPSRGQGFEQAPLCSRVVDSKDHGVRGPSVHFISSGIFISHRLVKTLIWSLIWSAWRQAKRTWPWSGVQSDLESQEAIPS